MPRYRVSVLVENLTFEVDGEPRFAVAATTRFVSAANEEAAAAVVAEDVKRELAATDAVRSDAGGPAVAIQDVAPVGWWVRRLRPGGGFTFGVSDGTEEAGEADPHG